MARTRGATKNAVDDSADIPVPDQNPAGEDSLAMEKSAPKPKRTRSRRGKRAVEGQQETDEQEALNWDTVTAEAEEESEAEEGVGEHEEQSGRSKSRAGKTRAQLVSFPSIIDEGLNTGTMVPFPEPYIPKPRYTPVISATPKRTMSNGPPKTPKFDPEVHGKDLEKDLQEDDGIDTFEQLIKRSPKKKPVDNKSLDIPAPLDLDTVQVTEIQLPAQTEEERKILSEEPDQTEESIPEVKALEAADPPKGRVTRNNASAVRATLLTVRKTRAGASAPPTASPVATATARRGKQSETMKTTPPPASPPRAIPTKTVPVSPLQTGSKKPTTSSTPSKAPVKKSTPVTPPRTETKGKQVTPARTASKPVTTSPPQAEKKKPVPTTPLRDSATKTTSTDSPRSNTAKPTSSTPPKSISKPTASASPPRISSKQPTPSSPPRATGKKLTPSPPRANAKKAPLVSQVREASKKSTERPIAKPFPRKPLGATAPKAPLREKKPAMEPPPVNNEVLPIRAKRVASGPVPPTKRIRPTPPVPGAACEASPPAPRPRIASLNKPPPPARVSKPPTKPTGFRLVGEEVARKQAEAKEARKKRMEEAEAVKASLKEQEAKMRKPIPSKTPSVASKSSQSSNVSAAVNGQLERELASAAAKKAEESSKQKALSSPRPGQRHPTKSLATVPRPALVIQKKPPTAKLTTATSKPAVPAVSRGAAGPASGTVNGTAQLTPEQEDIQRKEQVAQLRKQAAERGKAAVLAWAAQQKNKQLATSFTETKQSA